MSSTSDTSSAGRRNCLRGCLAIIAAFVAGPAVSQQDFSGVEIRIHSITDKIFVLTGAGGNIGLVAGGNGALLVDDQYAPLSAKITSAIAEVSEGPVRFVINTHWHGDHTGGNANFRRAGAILLAHDNVRRRMSINVDLPLFDSHTVPAPLVARPVLTYPDRIELDWGGERIRVIHVANAHTDGDSIVQFVDSNVVHMGDTLWTNGYPRIDSGDGGGSVQGVIDAVERMAASANAETQFIPGHGELPSPGVAFLSEYTSMLRTIRDRVGAAITSGMSEDEVVQAAPTEDYDPRWGNGYMDPATFTRVVYRSLAR